MASKSGDIKAPRIAGWGLTLAILGILLLALVVRTGWMLYAEPIPVSDFESYLKLATGLLDYGQYGYPQPTAFRAPGYPFFLAVLMCISRSLTWLSLANVVLSTLSCCIVFFLAKRLFQRRDIALVASLLCAVNPTFVFYAPVLASENLFPLLVFGATLLAMNRHKRYWLRAAITGVLMGFAILTRPEALFYLPIVCALFWVQSRGQMPQTLRTLSYSAIVGAVAVCVLVPWYIRNRLVLGPGAGLGTNGGIVFYEAHRPDGPGYTPLEGTPLEGLDEVKASREGYRLGLAYIRSNPLSFVWHARRNTQNLYSPSVDSVNAATRLPLEPGKEWKNKPLSLLEKAKTLAMALYGLLLSMAVLSVLTIHDWPRRALVVVGAFLVVHWVLYSVVFWGSPRFRYLPEMFFCLCGAVVITKLAARRLS